MGIDAYEKSYLLNKIIKRRNNNLPVRIAFLDIDSTMTGSYKTTNATRKTLEDLGYVIIFVTARTEEMLMSSKAYLLSQKYGFNRPQPKLAIREGRYTYLPPEQVEPTGLLDPEVIAGSSGTQILIRQKTGGFAPDIFFEQGMEAAANDWRKEMEKLIAEFNKKELRAFKAHFENPLNYEKGISNVYQPKYRISISFQSPKQKNAFRAFVRQSQKTLKAYTNLTITDDSEPKKDLFVLYLTPRNGSKTKAADFIIKMITKKTGLKRSELQVLIAGDGHADFDMGIHAGHGANVTFLLAGGSRLTHALTCKRTQLDVLDSEMLRLRSLINETENKGYYRNQLFADRNIIICDEIYKGKREVESILSLIEYLETNTLNR